MGRVTLEQKYIAYVRNALDLSVENTGKPVIANSLSTSGIASRKQLRKLVQDGHIIEVPILHRNSQHGKGTIHIAYYTERQVPKWVLEQDELRKAKEEGARINEELRKAREERALSTTEA